jgi:O-antigen/teichoic acid export membrane protein
MVAGFVSLPILTRTLTKSDYGLLSLTFATLGILVLLGRLGFGEATTRFYYERSRQGGKQLREFCASMLSGSFASGLAVALVTLAALRWVSPAAETARCLRVACAVIVTRSVLGVIYQIYRGQERAVAFSIAQIATRYVPLALAIAILLVSGLSAYAVIVATAVGEALVAVVCLIEFAARGLLGRPSLSRWHLNAAFSYGAPLALGNSSTFFLDYGDRFLIERFLGLSAVAAYTVPYDLVSTLAAGVFGSIKLALLPLIFRLWESEGRAATSEFVSQVFTYSVALAIPAGVLFLAITPDLIVFLTSAKYGDSAPLMAYLLPGVFMGEMNFMFAAALMIAGGTTALAVLSVASGVVNVILNVILLPRWGLMGAACATTLSYGLLMYATYRMSRSVLDLQIKPWVLAESLLTTALMLGVLGALGRVSSQPALNLIVHGGAGAIVVALCLSLLDREIRQRTWSRGFRGIKEALRVAA